MSGKAFCTTISLSILTTPVVVVVANHCKKTKNKNKNNLPLPFLLYPFFILPFVMKHDCSKFPPFSLMHFLLLSNFFASDQSLSLSRIKRKRNFFSSFSQRTYQRAVGSFLHSRNKKKSKKKNKNPSPAISKKKIHIFQTKYEALT